MGAECGGTVTLGGVTQSDVLRGLYPPPYREYHLPSICSLNYISYTLFN